LRRSGRKFLKFLELNENPTYLKLLDAERQIEEGIL
jgi:hypothetical protein